MRFPALALVALLLAAPASAEDAALSQWVQFVPGGGQEARVVTSAAACPALTVDGASVAMAERAPPNANFPVRLCSLVIPPKAKAVSLGGTALPFVTKTPQRIMAFVAFLPRHVQVHQHEVEVLARGLFEELLHRLRPRDDLQIGKAGDQALQREQHERVVVRDDHPYRRRHFGDIGHGMN